MGEQHWLIGGTVLIAVAAYVTSELIRGWRERRRHGPPEGQPAPGYNPLTNALPVEPVARSARRAEISGRLNSGGGDFHCILTLDAIAGPEEEKDLVNHLQAAWEKGELYVARPDDGGLVAIDMREISVLAVCFYSWPRKVR